MRRLVAVILLSAVAVSARAQDSCARNAGCDQTINDSLTFEAGACLDGETRRYEYFVFTPSVGSTVTATVTSAFFAPELQIINSSSVVVAVDQNAGKRSSASATAQISSGGSWSVRVRNIDVATGGPFSLSIQCSVPPPADGYVLGVTPISMTLGRTESGTYHVTSTRAGNFSEAVTVSIVGLPADTKADPQAFTFATPGAGSMDIRVSTGDLTPAGTFAFTAQGRSTTGIVRIAAATLVVDAPCSPPAILNQPRSVSVTKGGRARLSITPSGSAPLSFQWFRGFSPSPFFPISGATSPEYETDAMTANGQYWVRVSNGCGTSDSATIDVTTTEAPTRRRAARH